MSDLIELEECPVQDLPSENVDGRSVDCPVAKRRRKDYTVADKLVVLAALNSGESAHAVSQRTGIDRKSLRLWKTQELALNEQSKKRIVRRLPGGGRSPFYPEIDAELFEFFSSEREQRRSVTYKTLQSRIQSSDFKSTIPAEFKVSDKYIYGWARRHNITSRRITHHGQVDNRPVVETLAAVESYFLSLRYASATLPTSRIFNMDETPCYVDMSRDSTLHFKGSKNVDGADTGYRKHRYTVVLCSCLDGRMLMPMIIFKGLQKAPKVSVLTKTAHVTASMSGSLDTRLAIE
jgi:hypothetical protein